MRKLLSTPLFWLAILLMIPAFVVFDLAVLTRGKDTLVEANRRLLGTLLEQVEEFDKQEKK